MKNWKTTLGGIGMILGALADIFNSLHNGTAISWDKDFIAICGGIALLFAKDFNVTGGSVDQGSKTAYKLPAIFPFLLIGLLLCAAPAVQAQEQNAVFAGAVATTEQATTQQFQFSAAFRKQISGPLYSMTVWDVSGITLKPFNLQAAQYSGSQALTVKALQPRPWISLWFLGSAGLQGTDGVSTGAQYGGGGYADIDCGKKVHVLVMPKVTRNTLTGTAFETRIYIGTAF